MELNYNINEKGVKKIKKKKKKEKIEIEKS